MSKSNNDSTNLSIDRALNILEIIAENEKINFTNIQKITNISKSSLSRTLNTIYNAGYIKKDPETQEYYLSLKVFELGSKAIKNYGYLDIIRPHLIDLSQKLNAIAQFSVRYDKCNIICIDSQDTDDNAFSIYTQVGKTSPFYTTSAGKAMLSTYTNAEIIDIWNSTNKINYTNNTITTMDELLKNISEIRSKGYAVDFEETSQGLYCVGAVLKTFGNKLLGSISLSTDSLDKEKEELFSKTLLKSVEEISGILGYY